MWKDSIKSHKLRLRENAFEMDLQGTETEEVHSDGVFTAIQDLCEEIWENPCLLVEYIYNKKDKQNVI